MALVEVKVPDIGDFDEVEVIEVLVAAGDTIKTEQSLVTVESDKASMEIPASHGGVVKELKVKLGDKVKQGTLLAIVETAEAGSAATPAAAPTPPSAPATAIAPAPATAQAIAAEVATPAAATRPPRDAQVQGEPSAHDDGARASQRAAASLASRPVERTAPTAALPAHEPALAAAHLPHASPSIRRFARELGVPLADVKGSGHKGRIVLEDVQSYVKGALAQEAPARAPLAAAAPGAGLAVLPWPKLDFAKFGAVERRELSRIKKIGGANLHRNWVVIPHVTNHDDADITELEAFRVQLNQEHEKSGVKVTMLAFLVKACVAALAKFPDFNASLDGDQLVLKKYFHIGFAADTPNGLVVPVIRDADRKGILALAREMNELAGKAREGKLSPGEMSGGCFSISSLGGIGGTYFTPIINAPEVAILGVCKSALRPHWNGLAFAARLMLPMSLSWDHRVIDGASAARFNAYLGAVLADFRRVLL